MTTERSDTPASASTLTAIVPVYNGAAFVANAIASAQRQSTPAAAILVVDDCSTDATAQIVESIARTDSRVVLLRNSVNSGPSFSRNRALSETKTAFAAFLDADDAWLPNHLASIQEAFTTFPEAAVAFTRLSVAGTGRGVPAADAAPYLRSEMTMTLLDTNPVPQSATAVRVDPVLSVGGYNADARCAEDFDLWVRLALKGVQFVEIPRVTILRTEHDEQVSVRFANRMYTSAWGVRRAAFLQLYGSVDGGSSAGTESLRRAQSRDLAATLNMRRRDMVNLVLELTDWLPKAGAMRARATQLVGWRWPFWRTAAFAYDCFPNRLKQWWRSRREPSLHGDNSIL